MELIQKLRTGLCEEPCRVHDANSGCDCAAAADAIEHLRHEKAVIVSLATQQAEQVGILEGHIMELRMALQSIADKEPATTDITLAHMLAQEARAALVMETRE